MTRTRSAIIAACVVAAWTFAVPSASPQTQASQALTAIIAEVEGRPAGGRGGGSADVTRESSLFLAAAEQAAADAQRIIDRLDALDASGLSHQETLSRDVLRWNAWVVVAQVPQFWFHSPVIPNSAAPLTQALTSATTRAVATTTDRTAYLTWLDRVAALLDAAHAKERGRADRGIILPDEMIDRSLAHLDAFTADPNASVFMVAVERLTGVAPDDVVRFRADITTRLSNTIAPAAASLQETLRALAPKAPNGVGWAEYPGGREAYRIAVRQMTTMEVSPEEVHRLGLEFIERNEREMAELRRTLGFTGTKAEFHERLRQDRRFYRTTPEEVADALMSHIRRIEPKVRDFFIASPEAMYGVQRLHPALEPSQTYGYYGVPTAAEPRGLYFFNGSRLEDRSLLAGAALIFHELVPGHHFQIMLQRENRELPPFRRTSMATAYTEGWGEYSSSVVAREMGMYSDPYDLYGRLVFDNFFNVRLVIDTGMNFYGWSRPKAMLFMREHTLESDVQIDSETIRYSVRSPAQALAYRMGRQAFVALRAKAEAALGDRFDIRQFHHAVLSVGSMPMTTLERHIDWWIAQQRTPGVK